MNVTVCEIPPRSPRAAFDQTWQRLSEYVRAQRSDLVLLPEMPFFRWLPEDRAVDPAQWQAAEAHHQAWLARLGELGASTVLTTQPVIDGERRFQESVVWTREAGIIGPPHRKRYLPEEPGFWEASWYAPGPGEFSLIETGTARIGFLICTEVWFSEHARAYGQAGAHLIMTPRASTTVDPGHWLAAGRTAAVVAGAYSFSSNFTGPARSGRWAGCGWAVDPDGRVLGTTSADDPFLTVHVDLDRAEAAKSTYPRYVA